MAVRVEYVGGICASCAAFMPPEFQHGAMTAEERAIGDWYSDSEGAVVPFERWPAEARERFTCPPPARPCAFRCGLAAEPGDIYCSGCGSGVDRI